MEPKVFLEGDFGRYSCKAKTFDRMVIWVQDNFSNIGELRDHVEERAGHPLPADVTSVQLIIMLGDWRDATDEDL